MLQPPWIDSHCHWDFDVLQEQRSSLLRLMTKFDVASCIIPGTESQSQHSLIHLARRDNFPFAIGLHPYFANQHDKTAIEHTADLLSQYAESGDCVAIGECGLDRPQAELNFTAEEQREGVMFHQSHHWSRQLDIFHYHLQWANQFNLPLIVHARGSNDQCCSLIRRHKFTLGGVVHAFSGSQQQAENWISLGFKLGLGGACSHTRAKKLQRIIKTVADDAWVLETDAPDMTPAFCAQSANSPVMIPMLAAVIANLRQTPLSQVRTQAHRNTLSAFPKLAQHLATGQNDVLCQQKTS